MNKKSILSKYKPCFEPLQALEQEALMRRSQEAVLIKDSFILKGFSFKNTLGGMPISSESKSVASAAVAESAAVAV